MSSRKMIFGETHPTEAMFNAFAEQHAGSAVRIPAIESVGHE
jgi:hypothetical protein